MSNDVGGEGAARELLSALHNLHALLRSPRVGPKVVEPLLLEVRRRVTALAKGSIAAVSPFEDVVVPAAIASWETRLIGALDAAARQHVDARTRLALEATVADVAPRIDALREALDIRVRDRVASPKLELLLGSLVQQALDAPAATRPFGDAVSVHALVDARSSLGVLAAPQLTLSLIAFAVSFAARSNETVAIRSVIDGGRVCIVAEPTSATPTHSFVAPLATDEAALLLFAPAGPLVRDPSGAISFALVHGQGEFAVPSGS